MFFCLCCQQQNKYEILIEAPENLKFITLTSTDKNHQTHKLDSGYAGIWVYL